MAQRILTGVAAGAAFLAVLLAGGWLYAGALALLAAIGFAEYVRLNGLRWQRPDILIAFAAVVLIALPEWPFGGTLPAQTIVWLLLFALLSATVLSRNQVELAQASLLFLGVFYVGFGFHYMAVTRELPHGLFLSLLTFACVWASDIGAYFAGRAVGRTKLWPAISPNKTVEGAAGGLALAVAVAFAFAWAQPDWLPWGQAVAIGLVAAVAGQMGDLIQSAYKRFRGVKDSGRLLPGHGGVLDRTDSWLIVFPLVHLIGLLPGT